LEKFSHRFTRVKDVTIIEVDWLAASIICIEDSTTTSTGGALLASGMML